jgi:Raf kinase inhibitor-like YbhB/YbcL family protein
MNMRALRIGGLVLFLLMAGGLGCKSDDAIQKRGGTVSEIEKVPATISVTSAAFEHNAAIAAKFTCQGGDTSPAISWSKLPEGTKSVALIVDDPDAPDPKDPKMTWVHWVLYNLPAADTTLAEGLVAAKLPAGTLEGKNDWKKTGYGGPCPPIGRHRCFHKVYALDVMLADLDQPTKPELLKAMNGHVLARGELIGTYEKTKE